MSQHKEVVDPFVIHALGELMDVKGSFNICRFDEICKILNVIPPPGHYDRLHLMHCTKYRDMPLDLREELGRLIYESLNTPGFELELKRSSLGRDKIRAITGKTEEQK